MLADRETQTKKPLREEVGRHLNSGACNENKLYLLSHTVVLFKKLSSIFNFNIFNGLDGKVQRTWLTGQGKKPLRENGTHDITQGQNKEEKMLMVNYYSLTKKLSRIFNFNMLREKTIQTKNP